MHEEYSSDRALIDLLLNMAMNMFLMVVILMVISVIETEKRKDGVPVKAEYIISATWPSELDCDVDMYVLDPSGTVVYFNNQNVGVASLEKDDRGRLGDGVTVDGKYYANELNEEKYTIRRTLPGEYVVNAHLYTCRTKTEINGVGGSGETVGQIGDPADVTVMIVMEKINPTLKEKRRAGVRLTKVWEEKTAFRFVLDTGGEVEKFDDTPKDLVKSAKEE
jgi:hypothetical protein